MKFSVDNIDACKPINTLLTILQEKGFVIEKGKVSDYHFNELYFLLRTYESDIDLDDININEIGRYSPHTFYCKCHWSIVKLRIYNSEWSGTEEN